MTGREYFEGLGCSPEEAEVCAAASAAEYRRQLAEAARMVARGCILTVDDQDRSHA